MSQEMEGNNLKTSKPQHLLRLNLNAAFAIGCCISAHSSAIGQDPTDSAVDNLRSMQRLALQTTGDLPTVSQEKAVLAGTLSAPEFLQSQKNNPELRRRISAFWLKQLNIFEPINYLGGEVRWEYAGVNTNNLRDKGLWASIFASTGALVSEDHPSLEYGGRDCPGGIRRYILGRHPLATDYAINNEYTCADGVKVAPYWDVRTQIMVPSRAIVLCGPDLAKCLPLDIRYTNGSDGMYYNGPDPDNRYAENINDVVTWEPGLIAADTILTNKPWSEVLTTERGFVNGAFVNLLNRFSSIALIGAPPLTYRTSAGAPITLPTLEPWDGTSTLVSRGSDHSGVITTFAFQAVTNGRRAKAVRSRSAFLCEAPVVSASIKPVASDEKDLQKRPYCSSCHVVIEPMASFFGQWPAAGVTYQLAPEQDAKGSFRGVNGNGVKDFAHILTEASGNAFAECAVQRSYEFLLGGSPTAEIRKALWPKLVTAYGKGDVWEVMTSLSKEQWLWK